MKKLIIILFFFCLFPFMVLGKVLPFDEYIFNSSPSGYAETNYPIPEPFGIKLGEKLDKDIIFEKEEYDNEFYVNPKIKNNIFDEYFVRTKFNKVSTIRAKGYFYKYECPLRRDFLLIKLKEKYPEGHLSEHGRWKFVQATKIEYKNESDTIDFIEFAPDFEIELYCDNNDNLSLWYFFRKGVPNYNGID